MASTYFNTFGPSYRGDTPVVGEIQPMTGSGDPQSGYGGSGGDVFVMATIKDGMLFLPVRKINTPLVPGPPNDSTYDGALLQVNDYAWSQSAITYYLKAAGADITIPSSDTFSQNYAVDFFKWKYQSGINGGTSGIAFYAFQDTGGRNPVYTPSYMSYPTVSFNVVPRDTNLCKINNPSTSTKQVIWYFQPRFALQDSTPVTFNSPGVPYPCCKNGTDTCNSIGHGSPACNTSLSSSTQCITVNGKGPTYSSVFTAANPGIDQIISPTTKLYAGTIYDANIDASIYGAAYYDYSYNSHDESNNNYCTQTSVMARQTFLYASSYVSGSGKYGALPLGVSLLPDQSKDQGEDSLTSVRLYHGTVGKSIMDCNGAGHDVVTHPYNQFPGFTFFLIPVKYFEQKSCQALDATSLIYSMCGPFFNKHGTNSTVEPWFAQNCSTNANTLLVQSGYSNLEDCNQNKGVYPYMYPPYCYDANKNVVNAGCGVSTPLTRSNGCVTGPTGPYQSPMNVMGNTFSTTLYPYNSDANSDFTCCKRTQNGSTINITATGPCYNPGQPCISEDNPVGCYWETPPPANQPVCSDTYQGSDCVTLCTSYDQTNCQSVACTDTFLAPGCVTGCTKDISTGCWYPYQATWICNGTPDDPPGCITACIGDESDCTPLACQNFSPGQMTVDCFPTCSALTATSCYYPDQGVFICGASGPANCTNVCSSTIRQNCISPNCASLDVPNCITACEAGEQAVADDGVTSVCHYVALDGGWICNGTPDDPPDCTQACSVTNPYSAKNNCVDAYCKDTNIPGCITACTSVDSNGVGSPEGCVFKDNNNGLGDPWWICSSHGVNYPSGCVDVCSSTTDTSANCKRVTCATDGSVQIPGCFPTTDPCGDGVWDNCWYTSTKDGKTPICTSVNYPLDCQMQCIGDSGVAPTWGNITTCTNVCCYDGTNPPGCSTTGACSGGGGGGGGGIPFWVWIVVGIVGLIIIGIVAFAAYYFSRSKPSEDLTMSEIPSENTPTTSTTTSTTPTTTTSTSS